MKKFFTFALAAAACLAANATVPNVDLGLDGTIVAGAYTDANTNIILNGPTYNYRSGYGNIVGEGTAIYTTSQVVFEAGKEYRLAYSVALEGDADCTISFMDYNINVTNTIAGKWVVAPATYTFEEAAAATIDFNFVIGDANSGANFVGWALVEMNSDDPGDPGVVDPNQKVAWNLEQAEELIGEGEFQFTGELTVQGYGANVLFVTDENGEAGQVMVNGNRCAWQAGSVIKPGFIAEMQEIGEDTNIYVLSLVSGVELFEDEVGTVNFAEEVEGLEDANLFKLITVNKVQVNGFYEGEDLEYIIEVNGAAPMAEEGDDEPGVVGIDASVLGVAFCGNIDEVTYNAFQEGSWLYNLEGFIGISERGYVFYVQGANAIEAKKPYLVSTEGLTWVADDTFEFEGSFEVELDIWENLELYTILYRVNREGTFAEYEEPFTITEDTYLEACSEGFLVRPSETLTIQFLKNMPVGIDAIAADRNVKVYNLQGVQVSAENLPAGLYIVNGKKVIVRK